MKRIEKPYCLNCDTPYPEGYINEKEKFCPKCGQTSKASRLSIVDILKDAISNIFNLDSRLAHTLRDILFTSRLTKTYIQGKRKYYVNPARLFVFSLIILISSLLWLTDIRDKDLGADDFYARAELSKLLEDYNNMADTLATPDQKPLVDNLRKAVFRNVKDRAHDTLGLKGPTIGGLNRQVKEIGISTFDAINLEESALFNKYKVTDWKEKIVVRQYIKFASSPSEGLRLIIKNSTWTILIAVFILSIFMYLIYLRNEYYLVEHLVLLLYAFSLVFIYFILLAWVKYFIGTPLFSNGEDTALFMAGSILSFIILQHITLYKYFQQARWKTLIKQFMINFAFVLIVCIVLLFVVLISVFLY